ncbi:MAG: T9SS type A sorting domain-containing protein, partial [Elusimicrobia bacterium]|nr:T9SS type A sorting domain-containing protein [Elusimicrobiota bacterium]
LKNPNGPEMNGTGEYFLIENRQKVGYDQKIPGSGILIWRVDETQSSNVNRTRKLLDLVEADNQPSYGDSGDPFPGNSGNRIWNDSTTPNSKLYGGASSNMGLTEISSSSSQMTATVQAPQPAFVLNKSSLSFASSAVGADPANQTFSIQNNGADNSYLVWTATTSSSWLSISAVNGSLAKGSQIQITVSVKTSNLTVGIHQSSITISDPYASNPQGTVPVQITIEDLTPVVGSPSLPTDEGDFTNSTNLTFSWGLGSAEDPESGIAGYHLQVGTAVGGSSFFNGDVGNSALKTVSGAVDGETYYARTRAKNGAGLYGPFSFPSNGITVDLTPPARPSSILVKTHPDSSKNYPETKPQFKISGPNDLSGISGYYWRMDSSSETVPQVGDSFSNTGVIVATHSLSDDIWYFHAIAKDGAGNLGSQAARVRFMVKTRVDVASENKFETSDGAKVEIPAGTLDNPTQITIETKSSAPPSQNTQIKVSKALREITLADGTRNLKKEVTVHIPYTSDDIQGIDESKLRLFFYDENQNAWTLVSNSVVDTSNKTVSGRVNHFTLFGALEYSAAATLTSDVTVYPNPYQPSLAAHLANGIKFKGLPAYSAIKIYTLAGELVKQMKDEDGDGTVSWNAKNESGQDSASGIYLSLIEDGDKTKTLKLAIQR